MRKDLSRSRNGSGGLFKNLSGLPFPRWPTLAGTATPIDAFVKKSLDEKGLAPAPQADRNTLIRRATLDLIGLLPTPQEVEAFVNDPSPRAYENLIERLLSSPHYGERWGRFWLDVVRYADSSGFEHDKDLANAWRYRDYVIKAFNQDKPFDRFILEQLAGDELADRSFDSLTATTYYRIGPRVRFREKDNPYYRYEYLDDIIRTTFQGFMGLSVNCARCHDHKFDPDLADGLLPVDGDVFWLRRLRPSAWRRRTKWLNTRESRKKWTSKRGRSAERSPRSKRPTGERRSRRDWQSFPKRSRSPSRRRTRSGPRARSCWPPKLSRWTSIPTPPPINSANYRSMMKVSDADHQRSAEAGGPDRRDSKATAISSTCSRGHPRRRLPADSGRTG